MGSNFRGYVAEGPQDGDDSSLRHAAAKDDVAANIGTFQLHFTVMGHAQIKGTVRYTFSGQY